MKPNQLKTICFLSYMITLAPALAWGGEALNGIYIATHNFVVTVSPIDEESRNAENADLYQRDAANGAWRNLGSSKKITLPNGEVRFLRTVTVDSDGMYQFTSRPVVGGEVSLPPEPKSPPQAVVIVDTLPPLATIIRPEDAARLVAGESLDIEWKAEDDNLLDLPAELHWSRDGGETWALIGERLVSAGDTLWRLPDDLAGPAILRLTAKDKAGNVGTAFRRLEIAAKPQPDALLPERIGTPEKTPDRQTTITEDVVKKSRGECEFDRNRSWLYYLMAVNLMRQNNPREALRYYWLSVKEDPNFIDARADIALAYIDLGAYKTARDVVEKAREMAPERIDLMHLMGETYHAEGMELLGNANSREGRAKAKELIDQAVEWYGEALGTASTEWRLAEQAASFYRLGEICYYVNMDSDGARAYWKKILDLHTPEPNSDLMLWAAPSEKERARARYQKYTYMRVSLDAWQNWARGYLEQLDARERAGIVDLMPAQRISTGARQGAANPATELLAPQRDGERSLFSLPSQFGSPDPVPAATGVAPSAGARQPSTPPGDYSFYAPKDARARGIRNEQQHPIQTGRGKYSQLSGGPDPVIREPVDPYAFPQGNRPRGEWHTSGQYGSEPVQNW